MRKITFIVFAALLFFSAAWLFWSGSSETPTKNQGITQSEDPAEAEYNRRIAAALDDDPCPEAPARTLDPGWYQGPLTDTHFHISTIPDATPGGPEDWKDETLYTSPGVNMTMGDYVCLFTVDGTSGRPFAFFPVYPNIEWQSLKLVRETINNYPDKFVPFINAPDGPLGSVDGPTLERMLGRYPGLFRGFGEQGLYDGGAGAMPPDSERMRGTYPVVRRNKLLVYFHLGEGQAEGWEKVLSDNPDIKFIWHGDQLVLNPQGDPSTLRVIEGILSRHPNVRYGVDELYGDVLLLNQNTNPEQVDQYIRENWEKNLAKDLFTWKGFIERHPDQVMWGSDRGVFLYTMDPLVGQAMTDYTRAFIARLDPAVQEKFAYQNAAALVTGD